MSGCVQLPMLGHRSSIHRQHLQVHESDELLEGSKPPSAATRRPGSARPPSGRPLSGRPNSALPPSGRPLSGRPLSGHDDFQQRRVGFRAEAGEMEECLMEEIEEDVEESCSFGGNLHEPYGAATNHDEHTVTDKFILPSTRVPNQAALAAEDAVGCGERSRSRPVSAGAMSASLHTPWTHSESVCSGLHSGWSAPAYLSPVERPSSCQLQHQLAATSNLRCTPVTGTSTRVCSCKWRDDSVFQCNEIWQVKSLQCTR